MGDREWPVNRARAWLALNEHVLREDPVAQEEDFRRLLSHLGYYQEDIDRAVAEVYGEALASPSACASCEFVYGTGHVEAPCKHQRATTPRPAEEIAGEMVSDAGCLSIDECSFEYFERGAYAAQPVRAALVRLIECRRAEGAAAERARVEELEKAIDRALVALQRLDARGGLGLDVHAEIRSTVAAIKAVRR